MYIADKLQVISNRISLMIYYIASISKNCLGKCTYLCMYIRMCYFTIMCMRIHTYICIHVFAKFCVLCCTHHSTVFSRIVLCCLPGMCQLGGRTTRGHRKQCPCLRRFWQTYKETLPTKTPLQSKKSHNESSVVVMKRKWALFPNPLWAHE